MNRIHSQSVPWIAPTRSSGSEQRVGREHEGGDEHDAGHVLDRTHAGFADPLDLEEVDRPEEEVAEREQVADRADLGLPRRGEQHDSDTHERDHRPADVVPRDALAEHLAGDEQHERRLHRADELRVHDARALHGLEEESDLPCEEQPAEERPLQPGDRQPPAGRVEEQHHRWGRDPHPPERDRDRGCVDRLDRDTAESPAADRERDAGDREPRMVFDARRARGCRYRSGQDDFPSPRASGGRRSTRSTRIPSSIVPSASPMIAKS